jgi:peptide/nickel transport system substrate-binding protein
MAGDNRGKWYRLPKLSFDKRVLRGRLKKAEGVTVRHAHKFIIKRWSNVREVQWHVISWVIVVGLLIAATGLQLMWYQNSYRTSASSRDGTYAEAVLGPLETLNPLFASSSAERSASRLMFSSILQYDKTGHLNNDLATGIAISSDYKTYTVSLRKNVKWHDGEPLTAKDIAFTIDLIKNPNARTSYTGWDGIEVKVINDSTIQFKLQLAYAAFEHILVFPIVPKHILDDVPAIAIRENAFSKEPVGTGPFRLRLVQNVDNGTTRKIVRMARNDNYYAGTPNLARFQLHVYDDTDAIIRALSLSEVNAAADLLPDDLSRVDENNYESLFKSIQSGMYAILNTKSSILSDVSVRKALQLTTNTVAIRDRLPQGALPLDLPFTDGQITGKVPKPVVYNPDEAKKILTKAGWKQNETGTWLKNKKELQLSVVTTKNDEFERTLETLAGQWRAFGIIVDTQVIDLNDIATNAVQTILRPRNFDVLIYQLNIGADPDVYAYWHSSQASEQGYNFSNYSSVISDDALSSARVRADGTLRNAKYITFANQWLRDVPAIGLYQSTTQYIHSRNSVAMEDLDVLVSPTDRYADVINWSVGSQTVYKTP